VCVHCNCQRKIHFSDRSTLFKQLNHAKLVIAFTHDSSHKDKLSSNTINTVIGSIVMCVQCAQILILSFFWVILKVKRSWSVSKLWANPHTIITLYNTFSFKCLKDLHTHISSVISSEKFPFLNCLSLSLFTLWVDEIYCCCKAHLGLKYGSIAPWNEITLLSSHSPPTHHYNHYTLWTMRKHRLSSFIN